MSDSMKVLPFKVLLRWALEEYASRQSIFGLHRTQFCTPRPDSPYLTHSLFGCLLGTPIGPAAGPHTQLAQNIVSAWLTGGRFIELKTVQVMDMLEIPRPCIDMEDEGYNVEWSQELRLAESAEEYVKAWALIHILRRVLGHEGVTPFDTVFNMSVGYNLEGLQSAPMTRFMDLMADASELLEPIRVELRESIPQFADLEFPAQLVNSVTLSTMHGCPPDEIERIARYLLEARGLHTTVKLNPTLLGKERVLDILHAQLGFSEIDIPDAVFEHDLKYERAVELIRALQSVAEARELSFGVKLSNTLAMSNHRHVLPGQEMYMSGRALYPITLNLFDRLAHEFDGNLNVSYSAGADALNLTTLLAAGALPVTVASDLLKPGGYARLLPYLENLEADMQARGVSSLADLARNRLDHLHEAALAALGEPRYQKSYATAELPKVALPLGHFDCITAPCVAACPVNQDIPEYAWAVAHGEYDRALEIVLARNPLPGVTSYICTHVCQTRCTRSNYDEPVSIRALKRAIVENGQVKLPAPAEASHRVAIVGAGPSGLAAASFLALNGVQATIFEASDRAGGMMNMAPVFRLPREVIQADVDRIADLGVDIKLSHPVTTAPEGLLKQGFEAVYMACGFPKDTPLEIDGIQSEGVFSALELLDKTARAERPALGARVLVVGGGNTAMDAARTAQRLSGQPVTLVYRRTVNEMPADKEERADFLAEGNQIVELATPVRVVTKDDHVTALECLRNRLGEPGPDGRRKPEPVPGSHFELPADAIIIAIGQSPDLTFLDGSTVSLHKDGRVAVNVETKLAGADHVYAGGDAVRGPATIIQACADGRAAAEAICQELGIAFKQLPFRHSDLSDEDVAFVKRARARKEAPHRPPQRLLAERSGFDLVEATLSSAAAQAEAQRCLQCSTICDKCVEVCPNRANLTYFVQPQGLTFARVACRDREISLVGRETFQVRQARQIIHLDDLCNECGNCATFCVQTGRPYRDKPRLFFKESDFALEADNAFLIERGDGRRTRWVIRRREGSQETRLALSLQGQELSFENSWLRGVITLPQFEVDYVVLQAPFEGEFSLSGLAEMYVILLGVTSTWPFLVGG